MPKKNSSKKPTPIKAEISTKKPSASKKAVTEIDEIFADGKKRKLVKENEASEVPNVKKKMKKSKKSFDKGKIGIENVGGFKDEPFRPRKKTGDGLKVYTEDELGLANDNSGGTRLCPFDCDCCF
ncbi:hypothetical protein Leryth_004958 [Lithospermum erythrorhizon]|nr:hypothetical protein Leryth_004958 [Lithospermum erythrorhizon]